MLSNLRRGVLAGIVILSLVPAASLADGATGGQDPPEGRTPASACDLGVGVWDPFLQTVVLITQVTLL